MAGVITMALAAVGCGDERSAVIASGASPPTSADEPREPVPAPPTTGAIIDCAGPQGCFGGGWNDFVHSSVGAVIGTVESVSAPRWNQESGEPWDGDVESHPGNPLAREAQYREATISVEDVVFSDPGEALVAGGSVSVRLSGDGTATGARIDGLYENEVDGPVIVGSRVLWVLHRHEFNWKERVEHPLGLASFKGNWRIEGDTAVNLLPVRTVPLDALVAAIEREARASHRPDDLRGQGNPLE